MPSEIKKRENHTADPRADVRDASLCLMLLEGPTKVAMQHAEDRSLLVHALRNAQEWQGARLPPNDRTLHAVVMVTAAWFPQARRMSASGRYSLLIETRRASSIRMAGSEGAHATFSTLRSLCTGLAPATTGCISRRMSGVGEECGKFELPWPMAHGQLWRSAGLEIFLIHQYSGRERHQQPEATTQRVGTTGTIGSNSLRRRGNPRRNVRVVTVT